MAYAKFMTDPGGFLVADGDVSVMARAVATLVWRHEPGMWQVHALGDLVPPREPPLDLSNM